MSSILNPECAMTCPICLETMKAPIVQCQIGHSMCRGCVSETNITKCPSCRSPLTNTRNYQLEQLIEGLSGMLKIQCIYTKKGCKYTLSQSEKEPHEYECRFRSFDCEGKKWANWNCQWKGDYAEIYKHFKDDHNNHTWMQYTTAANMKVNFNNDFMDVQIISFFNGQQYFYYKHKLDVSKAKAYWAFQLIGTKSQAKHYYYEFEIHNDPVRKFKVTEMCQSDVEDVNKIFEEERCVVMSFRVLKNFLVNDELPFKFRIMSLKKK
ncbi:unnamed protein product [Acanthoscelides obtectus]|uniref:E3 ubiquitin-protein ligase n=1 Tax=Acanthoscelides obtectus TaxID=200917 RepID=A0A9P0P2W8_ACAOB|nr:unnamed protein product [Acanthoscelides obtectus]CAK1683161.1 E3 ubiquitin-protein ligase SIAH1 [Acanthoscelides obtectus]